MQEPFTLTPAIKKTPEEVAVPMTVGAHYPVEELPFSSSMPSVPITTPVVTPTSTASSFKDVSLILPQQQTIISDQPMFTTPPSLTLSEQPPLLDELTEEDLAAELAESEANLPDPFLSAIRLSATAIKVGKAIGHGAFGQVYQGQWGGRPVALKMIDLAQAKKNLPGMSDAGILESLEWEISRLSTLSHPNLVQFYGIWRAPGENTPYIVMEFCEGGSLQSAFEKGNITGSNRWQWALEITQGLVYLHQQGVLHRDLKAENILLDRYGRAKLADLGVAQVDALIATHEATVVAQGLSDKRFIAPEQMKAQTLSTPATDVYALGLVFWQMVTGKTPRRLNELSAAELQTWMKTGDREPIPSDCPESFKALILACWQREPAKRPSMVQLMDALTRLASEFHLNPSLIRACEQVDLLVHAKRGEGLAYVVPYITEYPLQEPVDTYWKRWELATTEKEAGSNPPLLLVDTFNEFMQQPGTGTLLLLGESGLGKTLSVYQWADQLLKQWWEYLQESSSQPRPSHFPILLRPLISHWSHQHLQHAFLNTLKRYGLQDSQIPLLILVDGYDECQLDEAPQNLADYLGISAQHPDTKLIVTCRPETVTRAELATRFAAQGQLQVRYFLPFRVEQLLTYLKNQLAWDEATYQQYQEKMQNADQLRAVLRNPFVLSLFAQSWETVSKKSLDRLNRWQIYEGFVEHSLSTHYSLISKRVQKWLTGTHKDLLASFQVFASEIAFTAFQKEKVSLTQEQAQATRSSWILLAAAIDQDSRQRFALRQKILAQQKAEGKARRALLTEQDYVAMMQRRREQFVSSLPLKERIEDYEFTHKSFFEYFAARQLIELSQLLPIEIEQTLHVLLADRLVQSEPGMLIFWVEGWQSSPGRSRQLIEPLFNVIIHSRTQHGAALAASNAATLLSRARVPFSGRDLQEVIIPNADLSGAVCDNTLFRKANLQGVNFKCAWLNGAQFTDAQMYDVAFGEYPSLQLFKKKDRKEVRCVAYRADGAMIATGDDDGNVSLYQKAVTNDTSYSNDPRYIKYAVLIGHQSWVDSVVFGPSGSMLASAASDETVRLWDTKQAVPLRIIRGYKGVIFSPDGLYLVMWGREYDTIRLWDTKQLDFLNIFQQKSTEGIINPPYGVAGVALSPDGSLLASVARNTIRLWDTKTLTQRDTLVLQEKTVRSRYKQFDSVIFSPNGNILAAGCSALSGTDNTIYLWNARQLTFLGAFQGGDASVLAFSPDGSILASAGSGIDNTLHLWDTRRISPLGLFPIHENIRSLAFSPDGSILALTHGGAVSFWDVMHLVEQNISQQGHISKVTSIAFSPDNAILTSGGHDKAVRFWDVKNFIEHSPPKMHRANVNSIAFGLGGLTLASASGSSVYLWDVKSQATVGILPGLKSMVNTMIAFSPDGIKLATCSNYLRGNEDYAVHLWDSKSLTQQGLLEGHTNVVNSIAFNPNGSMLASGSEDKTIRLWDAKQLTSLGVLNGHEASVNSVTFNPDGTTLASAGNDKIIRIWDLQNLNLVGVLQGHTYVIKHIVFDPKGLILASGGGDETVRLWDMKHFALLCVLRGGHNGHSINSLAFSPDGLMLASGGGDGAVLLWVKMVSSSLNQASWMLVYRFARGVELNVSNALFKGASLSENNFALLHQRGAHIDKRFLLKENLFRLFFSVSGVNTPSVLNECGKRIANSLSERDVQAMMCVNRNFYSFFKALNETAEILFEQAIFSTAIEDTVAQHKLGMYYYNGEKIKRNLDKAVHYFHLAAQRGHAGAQYSLGACYYNGQGVKRDWEEAVRYYRLAAEQGHANAQYSLGACYYNGQGIDQNFEEAVHYFCLAEKQRYVVARYMLGLCYAHGKGVEQDFKEAARYYRLAAEQGYADAQRNLGICYANGQGVEQDFKEAMRYYRLAAEQGDADAQHNLGICYANGQGVEQDWKEAVHYYHLAAEQGYANTQYNLAVCYLYGEGVEKNLQKAVSYVQLAAQQGNEYAQNNLGIFLSEQAMEFYSQNNLEEAIKAYEKCIEVGDNSSGVYQNLACLYFIQNKLDLSEQRFQMALELKATASLYCDYGLMLKTQKRFDEAIKMFLLAISLADDGSGLVYGPLEKAALDTYLQKEIDQQGKIEVKPLMMAYYLLASCYQTCYQFDKWAETCKALQEIVELDSNPFHHRLLSYLLDSCEEEQSTVLRLGDEGTADNQALTISTFPHEPAVNQEHDKAQSYLMTSERSIYLFTSFFNAKSVLRETGKRIGSYLAQRDHQTIACVNQSSYGFFAQLRQIEKPKSSDEEITVISPAASLVQLRVEGELEPEVEKANTAKENDIHQEPSKATHGCSCSIL